MTSSICAEALPSSVVAVWAVTGPDIAIEIAAAMAKRATGIDFI
jgi:hypothetical protein